MVPYCYLFLLSVFILWFTYYVHSVYRARVPFVNCCQFMYLVGFEDRIWDLIVSVPNHCLSFYFN